VKYLYLVVAAVLIAAAVRRMRRRGGAPSRPSPVRRLSGLVAARGVFGYTGLVAAREVHERFRGRLFKVVTLILLLVVAAAIVIPTLRSGKSGPANVGVVGSLGAPQRAAAVAAAKRVGVRVRFVDEPGLARARSDLRAGRVAAVIDDDRSVLVATPLTGKSKSTQAVVSVASALGVDRAFSAAGLSPSQTALIAHAKALPIESLAAAPTNGAAKSTAVIGVILVFIMLTQYLTWTLMGVMEEKQNRVVEVLLAAVAPLKLLAGKVLGIGTVAMAQAGLVVAFALVLADAVGSDLLKGAAPVVVVVTLVWLVLGYAFYSWVYAAAGSMAERQDQVQSLALPLSTPIIFGYIIALVSAESGSPSVLVKVLAYVPPTAPFAVPVLAASGQEAWWAYLLSALVMVVSTVGVARLAASVYRRAVLRTGRRVKLRELLAEAG
jgi:ABC-2 type transport system permease protein